MLFLLVFFLLNLNDVEIKKIEKNKELEIFIYVLPKNGDTYIKLAERVLKDKKDWKKIKEINKIPYPMLGVPVKIPFEILKDEIKLEVLKKLYPEDKYLEDGVYHKCKDETLWHISLWWTGDGKNYKILKEKNNLVSYDLKENQEIFIPKKILLPSFLKGLQEEKKIEKINENIYKESQEKLLEFPEGKDYAIYKLKKGEALYSSVVVRFTGIDGAEDVINLALEIAKLSGIEDVTKIPENYPIKIPKNLILPKYFPEGTEEREKWEEKERKVENSYTPVFAPELSGVYIILDAGHGGQDTGAIVGGIWESTYTYDIYNRLYNLLKERTQANVIPLVQDMKSKFKIIERDILPQHKNHIILTNPPERLENSQRGVNLRWKLANLKYRELILKGVESSKILFVSIHADALHQSIRGATFYIAGSDFVNILEKEEAIKSEGQSRKLAEEIAKSFLSKNIILHPYDPIRNKITRYKKTWIPAVLKNNLIQTKVLIEILNLNNLEDRSLLLKTEFRAKIAEAILNGVINYFQKNM